MNAAAQLHEILRTIYEYQWIIEIVLLLICLGLPIKTKAFSSDMAALAAISIIGGCGYKYGLFILQTDPDVKLTAIQSWLQANKDVLVFVWYLGFCFFDNLAMVSIYLVHKKFSLLNSFFTKTVILGFFIDAMINLFRFVERYVFGTDYLQPLYRWGIPSINTGVLIVAITVITKVTYKYFTDRKQTV
jgi:hypothetical protein